MEQKPEEISFYSPGERLFLLYDYLLKNTNREYVVTPKQINNFLNDHGIFIERKPFTQILKNSVLLLDRKSSGTHTSRGIKS